MKVSKRKTKIWLLIILLLIALCVVFLIVLRQNSTEEGNSSDNQGKVQKNEDVISIPGYEGITLKADSLKQDINFKNPEQNTCYFVITLYLEDGTELWQSDYIKPGDVSSHVTLTQTLPEGAYPNAILHYSCFAMNIEKTPLNGAETKLTLRVK